MRGGTRKRCLPANVCPDERKKRKAWAVARSGFTAGKLQIPFPAPSKASTDGRGGYLFRFFSCCFRGAACFGVACITRCSAVAVVLCTEGDGEGAAAAEGRRGGAGQASRRALDAVGLAQVGVGVSEWSSELRSGVTDSETSGSAGSARGDAADYRLRPPLVPRLNRQHDVQDRRIRRDDDRRVHVGALGGRPVRPRWHTLLPPWPPRRLFDRARWLESPRARLRLPSQPALESRAPARRAWRPTRLGLR